MKLIILLAFCGLAAAAVTRGQEPTPIELDTSVQNAEDRSWVLEQAINALIRQAIAFLRLVILNGYEALGIPRLDPLILSKFNISLFFDLINVDLDLRNVLALGLADFEVHRSRLNLAEFSLDLDIEMRNVDVFAAYDLLGDLISSVPLYGKGIASFVVSNLRCQGKVYLGQSADGKAVIITDVRNTAFQVPYFKSGLTGVIGGGRIDAVVNAVIEDVGVHYVNRFHGYIASLFSEIIPVTMNPLLEQLDTWKYIESLPIAPKSP